MTLKASAASMFVLLLALAATTVATPSYADGDKGGDKKSESASDNGSNNNGATGEVENEANDENDNGGVVKPGGKVSGIDCTVTRSDGVKVFC